MKRYVYDVEVAPNFFSVAIMNYDTKEQILYEISERKNDIEEIYKFFTQPMYLIGFNSKHYDDIIIARILHIYESTVDKNIEHNTYVKLITKSVYYTSQGIIEDEYFKYKRYKYWKHTFKTIDLYLYWSKMLRLSKMLSLKSIACQLNHELIQELPYSPDDNLPLEALDEVLKYNMNDVQITYKLAKKMSDDINLRLKVEKDYKIPALSRDGVNMGVDILLSEYCKHTGLDKDYVKKLSTNRNTIKLQEVIFPNIEFKNRVSSNPQIDSKGHYVFKSFGDMFDHLKNREVETTSEIKYTVFHKDVKFDYGSGGIHGICDKTIITPKEDEVIIDGDVTSMYPSIAIEYSLRPEHLGDSYINVYEQIVQKRKIAKKAGDKLTSDTLKLSVNGTYGMYANPYSWLHDIIVTFKTTINGQLLLSMLIEDLSEIGWVFTANTDGVTTLLKKANIPLYYEICAKWEKKSKLLLEYDTYDKMVMKNVNNYIWIKDKKAKKKGLFNTAPVLGNSTDNLIIPKALEAYFVHKIKPEEYITKHDNIFDFCASPKIAKKFEVTWRGEKVQNLNRFYVSKKGAYLYKQKEGYNHENVLKGYAVELYNKHKIKPIEQYDINYDYYIAETKKIINELEPQQLSLF